MSNILIIKHGSLGDIAQASGAIQDISDNYPNDDLYILSTKPYYDLLKKTNEISQNFDKRELEDILKKEGKAEVVCEFCKNKYLINYEEIKSMLENQS